MTTSPLKVEDSRAQFELAYSNLTGTPVSVLKNLRDSDEYRETEGDRLNISWSMWQSSRAAIVVELPESHAHLIWIQAGHAPDDYWDDVEVSRSKQDKCCDGSDRYAVYAEHEVAEMLAAAGITVKGDS